MSENRKNKLLPAVLPLLLLPALAGCFKHHTAMSPDLGESLYANMAVMTVNPAPSYDSGIQYDGKRAAIAVTRHGEDSVEEPVKLRTSEVASGEGGS